MTRKMPTEVYEAQLVALQNQLVEMAYWVQHSGTRVLVLFEGRDASGKGGAIKRILEPLNPRQARVVSLPAPSQRERTQWYFQRYTQHLPAAGEIVLFDRSWYNRAGVEHVMGFCTDAEYRRFLDQAPAFEKMLVDDGIIVLKYWLSVSRRQQYRRMKERVTNPAKRWKLSPMDTYSLSRYTDYSVAKDAMLEATDTPACPWYLVDSDDKKSARINVINHLLAQVPWSPSTPEPFELPQLQALGDYRRPPREAQHWVPNLAAQLAVAAERGRAIEKASAAARRPEKVPPAQRGRKGRAAPVA